MGRAYDIHGEGEKCISNLSRRASRDETTWKPDADNTEISITELGYG
jgi:hypothetical protein